jgi:hypothetical protein
MGCKDDGNGLHGMYDIIENIRPNGPRGHELLPPFFLRGIA